MKYLIVVPDGAGDYEIPELEGKTPLEASDLPCINQLASRGEVGMVRTIPLGVAPGSDAANLSVMGYDPSIYLTGRGAFEAASMGIPMDGEDMAFRANIVTLSGDGPYEELIIEDHSSGDISTEEADELIRAVQAAFGNSKIDFHSGVSYRHCMVVHGRDTDYVFTPPHDVLGKPAGPYLPQGEEVQWVADLMKKSYDLLKDHPVNRERIKRGLNPGNSLWIWGQGKKPGLSSFYEKYGITGSAISAVDLIKGIAACAGLESVDVEGATGTLHTNYKGKTDAAIEEFNRGKDFVYIHLEGPDECSHQGDLAGKMTCLHYIDQKVVKPVFRALKDMGEPFRILVVPDHRTPLSIRTHSAEPVPFVLYRSDDERKVDKSRQFNEKSGEKGTYFDSGFALADYFFKNE